MCRGSSAGGAPSAGDSVSFGRYARVLSGSFMVEPSEKHGFGDSLQPHHNRISSKPPEPKQKLRQPDRSSKSVERQIASAKPEAFSGSASGKTRLRPQKRDGIRDRENRGSSPGESRRDINRCEN